MVHVMPSGVLIHMDAHDSCVWVVIAPKGQWFATEQNHQVAATSYKAAQRLARTLILEPDPRVEAVVAPPTQEDLITALRGWLAFSESIGPLWSDGRALVKMQREDDTRALLARAEGTS